MADEYANVRRIQGIDRPALESQLKPKMFGVEHSTRSLGAKFADGTMAYYASEHSNAIFNSLVLEGFSGQEGNIYVDGNGLLIIKKTSDNGNIFESNGVYIFSSMIDDSVPTQGYFHTDNAVVADSTKLYISTVDDNGQNFLTTMRLLPIGSHIQFRSPTNQNIFYQLSTLSMGIENATHFVYDVKVTIVGPESVANNDSCYTKIQYSLSTDNLQTITNRGETTTNIMEYGDNVVDSFFVKDSQIPNVGLVKSWVYDDSRFVSTSEGFNKALIDNVNNIYIVSNGPLIVTGTNAGSANTIKLSNPITKIYGQEIYFKTTSNYFNFVNGVVDTKYVIEFYNTVVLDTENLSASGLQIKIRNLQLLSNCVVSSLGNPILFEKIRNNDNDFVLTGGVKLEYWDNTANSTNVRYVTSSEEFHTAIVDGVSVIHVIGDQTHFGATKNILEIQFPIGQNTLTLINNNISIYGDTIVFNPNGADHELTIQPNGLTGTYGIMFYNPVYLPKSTILTLKGTAFIDVRATMLSHRNADYSPAITIHTDGSFWWECVYGENASLPTGDALRRIWNNTYADLMTKEHFYVADQKSLDVALKNNCSEITFVQGRNDLKSPDLGLNFDGFIISVHRSINFYGAEINIKGNMSITGIPPAESTFNFYNSVKFVDSDPVVQSLIIMMAGALNFTNIVNATSDDIAVSRHLSASIVYEKVRGTHGIKDARQDFWNNTGSGGSGTVTNTSNDFTVSNNDRIPVIDGVKNLSSSNVQVYDGVGKVQMQSTFQKLNLSAENPAQIGNNVQLELSITSANALNLTDVRIEAAGDQSLVTKGYADANYSGGSDSVIIEIADTQTIRRLSTPGGEASSATFDNILGVALGTGANQECCVKGVAELEVFNRTDSAVTLNAGVFIYRDSNNPSFGSFISNNIGGTILNMGIRPYIGMTIEDTATSIAPNTPGIVKVLVDIRHFIVVQPPLVVCTTSDEFNDALVHLKENDGAIWWAGAITTPITLTAAISHQTHVYGNQIRFQPINDVITFRSDPAAKTTLYFYNSEVLFESTPSTKPLSIVLDNCKVFTRRSYFSNVTTVSPIGSPTNDVFGYEILSPNSNIPTSTTPNTVGQIYWDNTISGEGVVKNTPRDITATEKFFAVVAHDNGDVGTSPVKIMGTTMSNGAIIESASNYLMLKPQPQFPQVLNPVSLEIHRTKLITRNLTNALITEPDSLITKAYADANYGGGSTDDLYLKTMELTNILPTAYTSKDIALVQVWTPYHDILVSHASFMSHYAVGEGIETISIGIYNMAGTLLRKGTKTVPYTVGINGIELDSPIQLYASEQIYIGLCKTDTASGIGVGNCANVIYFGRNTTHSGGGMPATLSQTSTDKVPYIGLSNRPIS